MHRGEIGDPDVLEDPQDGELPLLVDEGVVGENREVESQAQLTRIDSMTSFFWIRFTISSPLVTCPNTVWTPSRCGCGEWQMKNWLPPVSFPA
jgi:hypothetical protein